MNLISFLWTENKSIRFSQLR